MRIKINNGKDEYIETLEYFTKQPYSTVKKAGYGKIEYIKTPAFLDTETSHNHNKDNPIGWIYQWCMEFKNEVVIGRTPSDLIHQLELLVDYYELNEKRHLVIFIHNASYDLTYLLGYLTEAFGIGNMLAVNTHKILSYTLPNGLEFRCSYLLTNMSLDAWCKKMKSDIQKMVGAIDYETIHYQDSELSTIDWEYQINDVLAMKSALKIDMINTKDTIATLPLTSTGYVRRDCRRSVHHDNDFRKFFKSTALSVDSYKLARSAFAGGYCHGNRFYGGITVKNVGHYDIKSHYP